MKSMTGFGKASKSYENVDISIEVKSVNSRFLDSKISLPKKYSFLELELQKIIGKNLKRGKVNVWVEIINKTIPELELNKNNLISYWELYKEAADILKIEPNAKLSDLLSQENIVTRSDNSNDDNIRIQIMETLEIAVLDHQKMAEIEGNSMKEYFIESLSKIGRSINKIEKESPKFKEAIYQKTKDNINDLLEQHLSKENYQRILLESAIYVDKADVTEEIVRLNNHLEKFHNNLNQNSTGKKINFILQEMHREINTIGSKFTASNVFDDIILIKEEIEKCREIVQNVE